MASDSRLRLAVILHADVVGSTSLVRKNEQLAHDRIQATFQAFAETSSEHNGVVREVRGDALVAEFSRASDAVLAALSAQQANQVRHARVTDDIAPELRVGIALGEVVIADGTVTGAGVVLAQRLEQLAAPGAICISGAVREAIPDRLPIAYADMGQHVVKGFDAPVHVLAAALKEGTELPTPQSPAEAESSSTRRIPRWIMAGMFSALLGIAGAVVWVNGWTPWVEPTLSPPIQAGVPSVAVLPFKNLSEDASQEYFSDGLTEDIITDLARISGLFVIARHSSFAYKGQTINLQQVGRELGARYLVEGSVRRGSDRVRVNAQLIDAQSGVHVWADRFDRKLTDVFELQDELTRTIVAALAVNLTDEEVEALTRPSSASFDAYDVLLRGNEHYARYAPESNAEARALYSKAIALNPHYARAHANLALTHALDITIGWTDDQAESLRLGHVAAEEARRLDATLPQLYYTLALLHRAEARWEDAERAARRALELEPNYADGAGILASVLVFLGDLDGAAAAIEKTKRLNPHYSNIVRQIEGRILYLRGRYEEAASRLQVAVERNPEFIWSHLTLAAAYAQLGRTEDALWEVEEALALDPELTLTTHMATLRFAKPELAAHYADGLRKAGLPD